MVMHQGAPGDQLALTQALQQEQEKVNTVINEELHFLQRHTLKKMEV